MEHDTSNQHKRCRSLGWIAIFHFFAGYGLDGVDIVGGTNGFHGMTLGSLSLTGNAGKRDGGGVSLGDVTHLPYEGFLFLNMNLFVTFSNHTC